MLLDLLQLAAGISLLLFGGEAIVRGASSLARSIGVSSLTIGLTVVAFGTSAPELAVNAAAALRGNTALSFGNIFGSNMANVGLVLGASALVRPLRIRRSVVTRSIPVMLLATGLATGMAFDRALGGSGPDRLDRGDGLVLLAFMGLFLYLMFGSMRRQRSHAAELGSEGPSTRELLRHLLETAVGLAALAAGARLTVNGSVAVAHDFGVPDEIIGLTLVAVGTSLPELVTSMMATARGQVDLAVGNVVGSNIFNILLVGGLTACIRPIPLPVGGHADLVLNAILSMGLVAVAVTAGRRVTRVEGAGLLLLYGGYMVWRTFGS